MWNKYFVYLALGVGLFLSCKKQQKNSSCTILTSLMYNIVQLDINITNSKCSVNSASEGGYIIELIDTSSYPFASLDELRAQYLISMLPEEEQLENEIIVVTKYAQYSNEYQVKYSTKEVNDIRIEWNANPKRLKSMEHMLSSFISEDWALLNALNDSLSPTFVNYNKLSVINKIMTATSEYDHYSLHPSAADNLALLYGLVKLYSSSTAYKLEPIFKIIEYPNYSETKYVKSRFKHINSVK